MRILPQNKLCRLFLYFTVLTFALWFFIFSFASKVKNSTAYKEAMNISNNHPDVIRVLGEPIEVGTFISGSLDEDEESGSARLKISLSGPNAGGMLYVVGQADYGEWSFKTIILESGDKRYDLLQKTSN